MALEKIFTPVWAAKQLPETVELVQIRGEWFMLIWTDDSVVSQREPEKWAFCNGELGESTELELWIPPTRLIAGLVRDIVKEMDEDAAPKEEPAKEAPATPPPAAKSP